MSELNHILQHNQSFVDSGAYEHFLTNKYPERKLAILSCMDTRMVELLPAALGLRNGDVKLIKNAGAVVTHPWGSVMRSLLVAVLELRVEEIMVIAHYDCGMRGLNAQAFLAKAEEQGVPEDRITTLRHAGIDLDNWLTGFDSVEDSVRHTVSLIRKHPLMPANIAVHGLVIHPVTGKLTVVVHGDESCTI
ncbi:beta-class carbonic anhydrase [Kingella kingae]|uniref:beta-class carbonic anhydrase n=1 Tax=Kingella kingae TaxID=504 RepID=UPI0013E04615|nr:carbonic anhydrase [Kingella kingae]MBD3613390.1 carbonic anhydrase [Kingella kingae]MBD3631749.1 carbonic anhydrase [Kingella kingae]MBD3659077.1 carbonic anhydrase [Kingella kingae]QIF42017.1 carbonic anhydrase [Kingella kingae]